jgi:hypothetical protein
LIESINIALCASSSSASLAAGACLRSQPGQPATSIAASIAATLPGVSGWLGEIAPGSCSSEFLCSM